MNRAEVRAALFGRRAGLRLVAPQIMEHACVLEQLPAGDSWRDPDALERALRSVRKLYDLDIVLVELDAARIAASIGSPTPAPLPEIASLMNDGPLSVAVSALRRLRTTIGTKGALGIAIPSATQLAAAITTPGAQAWSAAALLTLLREIGPAEPDAVLLCDSTDAANTKLSSICSFFNAAFLCTDSPGVVITTGAAFVSTQTFSHGWLITTQNGLPPNADPRDVSAAIARVRASI